MIVTEYSHKKQDNVALKPSMFNIFVFWLSCEIYQKKKEETAHV